MDISTLANLINAIAVTAGVIFAAAQIREFRRQRRRQSMYTLVQTFQSADFAKALHLIMELPDNLDRAAIRATVGSEGEAAIYFKAPWQSEFNDAVTKPKAFHVSGGAPVNVSTMAQRKRFGYAKRDDFVVVALPYSGGELQFVILLPDQANGLAKLESKLSADLLTQCAKLEPQDVDLELPKFKIEPPTIPLGETLQAVGMKTAFDVPQGSANFDKMSPRKPDKYLAISNVFHKTFIAVDEKGTEAAAATAVVMMEVSARLEKPKQPIEVKVDRPFLYAIQHVPSGACLFIGRVTDPR